MNRPLGITVIAIVLLISGVGSLLTGLVGLDLVKVDMGTLGQGAQVVGAGSILSGVLTLIVSYGIFATKGWAWLLTIIVMVLRIVSDGTALLSHGFGTAIGGAALVGIVISAIVLWYFNKPTVRAAFGR